LHAVWYDGRDGNNEIYYKRSTDGGIIWNADVRLTNHFADSQYPSISAVDSLVIVVWRDSRIGNFELYYKRSTDNGVSWSADTRLTNNPAVQWYPSVSASGSGLYVVWQDARDGNEEIYGKRSSDGGLSWGADTRLTNQTADSQNPSVSVFASTVDIVWFDNRDGNQEIYFNRSTDNGLSWGADTRLTSNSATSWYPSISESASDVFVAWYDDRDGNNEIYYKRSTNGGVSWGADTRLTNNSFSSFDPSIAVSGSKIHVAWVDWRDGNREIYYKYSTDGGLVWSADTRLTNNPGNSWNPSISLSALDVNVVWSDDRDGNFEIYYKNNADDNVTGLETFNSELPQEYSLEQNYPNPFNPTTSIQYQVSSNTQVSLKVYDVLGNEVATLVDEYKPVGNYEVIFNATGLSSGIYFYKLQTGSLVDSKKMIYLK
jgi:hypothetical protein